VAHSRLQPQPDASVAMTRLTAQGDLKIDRPTWTKDDFEAKCSTMKRYIEELQKIRGELSSVIIFVDAGQSWNVAAELIREAHQARRTPFT
jgi:hypothetical protein